MKTSSCFFKHGSFSKLSVSNMHFLAKERIEYNRKNFRSTFCQNLEYDSNVFSQENLIKIYFNTILRIESEIGFIVVDNMKVKNLLKEFCDRIVEFYYFFPYGDESYDKTYENDFEKISEKIMIYHKKNIKELNLLEKHRNFDFKNVRHWKNQKKIDNLKLLKKFMVVKYNYTKKNTYLKTLNDFQKYTEIYFSLRCFYKKNENSDKIEQVNEFKKLFYTILQKENINEKCDFYLAIDFKKNDVIFYSQTYNNKTKLEKLLYEQNNLFQDVSNNFDAIIFNPFCTLFIWKNEFDFVFNDQKYYLRFRTLIQKYIFEIQKKIHKANINFENFLIDIFKKLVNIVFPGAWDDFEILETLIIEPENILINTKIYKSNVI
ncbi:hypothetical protein GVAV_001735 [Gurleya vavrai]